YVTAAYEAGIVFGRTATTFDPHATITREEMAVMLIRAYEYQARNKVKVAQPSTFNDRESVSSWAQAAVDAASQLGLLKGRGNNIFAPKAPMTRAESAQVIANLLKSK
ncbi:S-layer homology domain-containing protein, partial [Anaerobacillus alkaliphilus]